MPNKGGGGHSHRKYNGDERADSHGPRPLSVIMEQLTRRGRMRRMSKRRVFHILVGVTGSVAALHVPYLVEQLYNLSYDYETAVRVVVTDSALHFLSPASVRPAKFYTNREEWESWKSPSDPVRHIELRQWADLLLLAPLDANTMAKLSVGMCDNLLTCVCRCWESSKPVLFCPAMNHHMWSHPLTSPQLETLVDTLGYTYIPCLQHVQQHGQHQQHVQEQAVVTSGAMASVETITSTVRQKLDEMNQRRSEEDREDASHV